MTVTRPGIPEFVVPTDWSRARIRRHLAERLNIRAEGVDRGLVFYDTFDWLLHRAGFYLEFVPGNSSRVRLADLVDGHVVEQRLDGEPPRFMSDWPRGAVKSVAGSLTDVRALLPLVRLVGSADRYAVLNRDGKTVCRLSVERWRVEKPNPGSDASLGRVRVETLRGWHDEAGFVVSALSDAGYPAAGARSLDSALAAIGRHVRDYSQKFRLALSPNRDAAGAGRDIFGRLFDDMQRNEDGMRRDVDPEFLHDYRVAVRRTRSAMTAFKDVFGKEALEPHAKAFRDLGRLTGNKRNLDVHLIDFEHHLQALDDEQRAAMAELRRVLESERQEAASMLASYLKSPLYRVFKRDYRAFLEGREAFGPAAAVTVRDFADLVLWKAYRRIVKDGRAIGARSPDEALHELRKRGKKFRYLMEFFQSLYPVKSMKAAIAELRRLQDRLGVFQDQSVQIQTLESLRGDDIGDVAASAIDTLVGDLTSRKRETREHFDEYFARFDTKTNRAHYRALFKPGSRD